jgi:hypothetical protein
MSAFVMTAMSALCVVVIILAIQVELLQATVRRLRVSAASEALVVNPEDRTILVSKTRLSALDVDRLRGELIRLYSNPEARFAIIDGLELAVLRGTRTAEAPRVADHD